MATRIRLWGDEYTLKLPRVPGFISTDWKWVGPDAEVADVLTDTTIRLAPEIGSEIPNPQQEIAGRAVAEFGAEIIDVSGAPQVDPNKVQ
jgi:hypothetical protein